MFLSLNPAIWSDRDFFRYFYCQEEHGWGRTEKGNKHLAIKSITIDFYKLTIYLDFCRELLLAEKFLCALESLDCKFMVGFMASLLTREPVSLF